MTKRKYDFSHLTDEDLDKLSAKYPKSVEIKTVRKPVYKVLAMIADCGADLPENVELIKKH